jgi:DNA modification methylase
MPVIDQRVTDQYSLYHGDVVQVIKDLPDNSIGYSIYSPPFAELFTYSNNEEDMGNSKNYKEFFEHYSFLLSEIYRVTQPGRSTTIHCMDIPAMKERDGYIGLKDFPGRIIKEHEKQGFIYHSRCTIEKDPLVEATRTKAIGLMHKQIMKDSAMCRNGLPDYLITMRKPGENKNLIAHPNGLTEYIGKNIPKFTGIEFSHNVWRKYAKDIYDDLKITDKDIEYFWQQIQLYLWKDINQSDTLNFRDAREEKDEKHICPLQINVIERCVELWSSPGDICFSPFGGIGSEPYVFIKKGRKAVATELKKAYYDQMVKNCIKAVKEVRENQKKLFSDL